ncbi:MAG TPA: hypothetical protein VGS02_01115, partial [Acidobacteriaceae bacterium]|nr:hypothetical protein [Acidobacteriaceae bacterium]
MQPILSLSSSLLKGVADPAARSLIVAGLAAATIGAFRVRSISRKTTIWRGVLVAALAMPLLGSLLPSIRVAVPLPEFGARPAVVQPSDASVAPTDSRTVTAPAGKTARPDVVNSSGPEEAPPVAAAIYRPIPWPLILTGLYLAIALLLLVRIFVGTAFGERLLHNAMPIGDPAALRQVALLARRSGLREQPLLA